MLLIEKAVKLMDDFHYNIYREYVQRVVQPPGYALRLLDSLSREVAITQSTEELCWKVYGEGDQNEEKRTQLLELAAHCFKLTSFLSKNYPNYLNHNITRIQHCFNTGDPSRANLILNMALDLARKIEDRDTEITLLEMLIQQEALQESNQHVQQWYERIQVLLEQKRAINAILKHLHLHFSAKSKPEERMALLPHIDFFCSHLNCTSLIIHLIARFNVCFIQYYVKDVSFYLPETLNELEILENELEKSPYLIFPFLLSINHRIAFLKLNYRLRKMKASQVLDESKSIIDDSEDTLYWNSFINLPKVFSIGVQTSHYLNNYLFSYRENHLELLDDTVKFELEKLKQLCQKLINQPELEEKFTVRYINLSFIYAGLLILGDTEDIKNGIELLNNLLLSYQQVPFHVFLDSLYTNLIIGYFALKDYGSLTDSYYRYIRTTKNKAVNPENDLTIKGFYYLSKWIQTGRPQYLQKLKVVINATKPTNLHTTRKLLLEAANYFNAPIYSIDEIN